MFLTTLKGIRNDDLTLRDRPVDQREWVDLHARLDALNAEVDRAKVRPATMESSRSGDRILVLQTRIEDGRTARRWSTTNERDFQYRLDGIRQDYLRMTENGRYASAEERNDIDRRLDSLERDVNRSS
jgi:tetrahydromethanopterin S-methyltransferase subunit G